MPGSFGKNHLGLDWGAAKIGVAFADAETRMAFAVTEIRNDLAMLDTLGKMFSEREIGTVVIGIPSHDGHGNGTPGGAVLGEEIRRCFPDMIVAYQDETFTTRMASANLKAVGKRNIARFDDRESARIILQEWLDRIR